MMRYFTKSILLLSLLMGGNVASLWATEKQFSSPDGKLSVVISDAGGKPAYWVNFGDVAFQIEDRKSVV